MSAVLISVAGAASAQAAYSYVVRPLEASSSGDRVPLRVVQGPEVTWVVPEGGPLTLASAVAVLRDNAPVVAGPGSLLVRGWERAPAAAYDTLSVELIRGVRDRPLAGRTADHYVLRALVERRDSPGGLPRRHRVTADFWVLPDVPFTWAPFAASGWLPRRFPHLREELEPRLSELGLVGRAEIRVEESLLLGGQPLGGDREAAAFEVSDLRRMEAPPVPGPVVERSLLDALERLTARNPGRVCGEAADGELPATVRARVDFELWPPLAGYVTAHCRESRARSSGH